MSLSPTNQSSNKIIRPTMFFPAPGLGCGSRSVLGLLTRQHFGRDVLIVGGNHHQRRLINRHFLCYSQRKVAFAKHLARGLHACRGINARTDHPEHVCRKVFRTWHCGKPFSMKFVKREFASDDTRTATIFTCGTSRRVPKTNRCGRRSTRREREWAR